MTHVKKKAKKQKRTTGNRHEEFAFAYCECLNGRQAYIKVYGEMSDAVADSAASRLLRNVKVQEKIEELRKYTQGKYNITRERIAKQYARFAFNDSTTFFDDEGNLKPFSQLTEDQRACINAVEVEENKIGSFVFGKTKKIKTVDQKGALDSLAKMFGFNEPEKLKAEIQNNFPNGVLQIQVVQPIVKKEEF